MTPVERYQADLLGKGFYADLAQENAVRQLQSLFDLLVSELPHSNNFLVKIMHMFSSNETVPINGLYIWGGVGRGKTYLMDTFYDCLPFAEKQRMHFHRFMQMLHMRLKAINNVVDPLKIIASDISVNSKVLCLDEFYVVDIADAMLLSGLLEALFERGVVLVTTSNDAPSRLYWDGLQRERFLPAIKLIERHTNVINIDSGIDYRLLFLNKSDVYYCPVDEQATHALQAMCRHIAHSTIEHGLNLHIEGRMIKTIQHTDGLVWFDFIMICGATRSYLDYIQIAKLFQTVVVSDVPVIDDTLNDEGRRFIALIDELYDRNVKLIVAAATEPAQLYIGKRLARPFLRTISRLEEMRTQDYLAKQHIP